MGQNVQALKIAGFLDALTSDLNDELTVMMSGLYCLMSDPAVQDDPFLLEVVNELTMAANRSAYRIRQAGCYAIANKKGV